MHLILLPFSQDRLSEDLSNCRAIESLLRDAFHTLKVRLSLLFHLYVLKRSMYVTYSTAQSPARRQRLHTYPPSSNRRRTRRVYANPFRPRASSPRDPIAGRPYSAGLRFGSSQGMCGPPLFFLSLCLSRSSMLICAFHSQSTCDGS